MLNDISRTKLVFGWFAGITVLFACSVLVGGIPRVTAGTDAKVDRRGSARLEALIILDLRKW